MTDVHARAEASAGASAEAVYALVESTLDELSLSGGFVLDVGCGGGALTRRVAERFERCVGTDVIRHAAFPAEFEFLPTNLDAGRVPLPDGSVDVVLCAETIEHVENPRALVRELVRLARPGGWIVVTTPNQLSLSSKLCLVARDRFVQFQDGPGLYPAHITALLEIDLVRIASECGLHDIAIRYSGQGRIPFTSRAWPRAFERDRDFRGRAFSDNVLLRARRPG